MSNEDNARRLTYEEALKEPGVVSHLRDLWAQRTSRVDVGMFREDEDGEGWEPSEYSPRAVSALVELLDVSASEPSADRPPFWVRRQRRFVYHDERNAQWLTFRVGVYDQNPELAFSRPDAMSILDRLVDNSDWEVPKLGATVLGREDEAADCVSSWEVWLVVEPAGWVPGAYGASRWSVETIVDTESEAQECVESRSYAFPFAMGLCYWLHDFPESTAASNGMSVLVWQGEYPIAGFQGAGSNVEEAHIFPAVIEQFGPRFHINGETIELIPPRRSPAEQVAAIEQARQDGVTQEV